MTKQTTVRMVNHDGTDDWTVENGSEVQVSNDRREVTFRDEDKKDIRLILGQNDSLIIETGEVEEAK